MTQFLEDTDLESVLPGDYAADRAATLVRDLNALLLTGLPCLGTLDPERTRSAKALVRLTLAAAFDHPGVESERLHRGPFSRDVVYGDRPGLVELLEGELFRRLAPLCSELRIADSEMYSVPLKLPGVYS